MLILPYIEGHKLYAEYDFSEPWDGPKNRLLAGRMPKIYRFHTETTEGTSVANYLAVVGDGTVWSGKEKVTSGQVEDGLSQTILIVENLGLDVNWMEPRDIAFADLPLWLYDPKGVSSPYDSPAAAFADGHVGRLRPDIDPNVLRALFTIRGGEPLDDGPNGWDFLPDGRLRPIREGE